MTDPSRLLERGASDLERLLLEAGIREEPGPHGVGKTAAALGVAAVVSSASPMVAAATIAQKVLWAPWMKWALLATTGPGLAVTVALAVTQRPSSDVTPVSPPAEPAPVAMPRAPAPAPGEPRVDQKPSGAASAELPALASIPTKGRPGAGASSLKDEIASLDRARGELHRGKPADALRTLDRYARDYPGGVLAEEAMLLRIEALAQSGNRPAAERLARRLLARHPGSPHAKRLASLLGPGVLEGTSSVRED